MTFDDVTSGEDSLIARNPLLAVAHARTPPFQGNPSGSRDLWSLPGSHGTCTNCTTFYTTTIVRKKSEKPKKNVTSCDVISGHLTDVTSGHACAMVRSPSNTTL